MLNGYNLYDMAVTSFEKFASGAMIYIGISLVTTSAANLGYAVWKNCMDNGKYTKKDMKDQVGLTTLTSIFGLPFAISYMIAK